MKYNNIFRDDHFVVNILIWASLVAQLVKNPPAMRKTLSRQTRKTIFLGGRIKG